MNNNFDPRYIVLLAHDFVRSKRVQIKGLPLLHDRVKSGTKAQVIFAPGQLRIYILTTSRRNAVPYEEGTERLMLQRELPPPAFRLSSKDHLPSNVLIRTVFESEQAIVFYSAGTQKRIVAWHLEHNNIADAIIVCERLIKFRAYSGLLTEKEMGQDYEIYQKILARALGTNFMGEQETALKIALKKALLLAGYNEK